MKKITYEGYIVITLGLYFGWLLSFPFYGPILTSLLEVEVIEVNYINLIIIFSLFHALTFILGGMVLRETQKWKNLMMVGLISTIILNFIFGGLILLNSFNNYLFFSTMGLFGIFSAVFILGWGVVYSLYLPFASRIKLMALTIILSNLILIFFNFISGIFSPLVLLVLVTIPLIIDLIILRKLPFNLELTKRVLHEKVKSVPVPLILIFSLFVGWIYISGGFTYDFVFPSLQEGLEFAGSRYVIYLFVLIIMYFIGEKIHLTSLIYAGMSLLGIAFISFALFENYTGGLIMTLIFMESTFALLDLFVWTAIGHLAFIYLSPYKFFGLVNGVMVISITIGSLIYGRILLLGENDRFVMALVVAGIIFLAYLIIPWIVKKMNKDFSMLIVESGKNFEDNREGGQFRREFVTLLDMLPKGVSLTPREIEITKLILKGGKNKDIAKELSISENTLKTHLRNIYKKFQVTQKRELLSKAVKYGEYGE